MNARSISNAGPSVDAIDWDAVVAQLTADAIARRDRPNIDFDDVKAAILDRLDDLIDELIPASSRGQTKGDEFWCCNPTRADKKPDSFSINTKTGQWYDFSGKQSGNILTLWCKVKGLTDNTDAMFSIAEFLRVAERQIKPEPVRQKTAERKIVATYDYTELDGTLLYQVVRYEPKGFMQRRPDGKGGWINNISGVKRVIYNWPLVNDGGDAVFLCEGEKDAGRLISLGFPATTIAGDGKWTDDCVNALADRDVFILPDNDEPGAKRAMAAFEALNRNGRDIIVINLPGLPEKGDISDWLDADPANDAKAFELICQRQAEAEDAAMNGLGLVALQAAIERFAEVAPAAADTKATTPSTPPTQTRDANEVIPNNDLPIIEIKDGMLSALATKAELMLIDAGVPIYQRGGALVRPIIETVDASRGRKTKIAQLRVLDVVYLRDLMGRHANWVKYDGRAKRMNLTNPPHETAATVLARVGDWGFKTIMGVISTPTMRPDGSLLMEQGFDEATGLLLVEPPALPDIPDQPTRENALEALQLIEGLLVGFPFVDDVAKSVALSAVLSTVVRGAFTVVPMHASRAPTAGSGKSFLWDTVAAIAIGQPMPVMSTGGSEDELEKRLGAALMTGQPLISIDNISGELGGDLLCQVIERPVVEIRILGRSEKVKIEARGTSTLATGNNFVIVGDLCRRVITVNLDPEMERPEFRQFDFDPVERILAKRGDYIAAALTICRAYFVAGRPGKVPRLASFEGWSDTVRSALIWLDRADPVLSMEAARAEDPESTELSNMLEAWAEVFGTGSDSRVRLADVILKGMATVRSSQVYGDEPIIMEPTYPELYAALEGLAFRTTGKRGQKPDPHLLGNWLRRFKGRVVDGKRFAVLPHKKGAEWWVDEIRAKQAVA
jgi:putative DNA primase/helicase